MKKASKIKQVVLKKMWYCVETQEYFYLQLFDIQSIPRESQLGNAQEWKFKWNSLIVRCWSSMHSKNRAKDTSGEKKRFVNAINTMWLCCKDLFYINTVRLHFKYHTLWMSIWHSNCGTYILPPPKSLCSLCDTCALSRFGMSSNSKAAFSKRSSHLLSTTRHFTFLMLRMPAWRRVF